MASALAGVGAAHPTCLSEAKGLGGTGKYYSEMNPRLSSNSHGLPVEPRVRICSEPQFPLLYTQNAFVELQVSVKSTSMCFRDPLLDPNDRGLGGRIPYSSPNGKGHETAKS